MTALKSPPPVRVNRAALAGQAAASVLASAEKSVLAAIAASIPKVAAGTLTPQMARRTLAMTTSAALGAASARLQGVYDRAAEQAAGEAGPLPDAPSQVAAAVLRAQKDAATAAGAVLAATGAPGSRMPPPSSPYRRLVNRALATSGGPGVKAARAVLAAVAARGLTGYVSPRGRRWTLADYGQRAVRMAAARVARSPVTSQIAARREALLAVHVQAVSGALDSALARLDARSGVARFRGDSRVTSTASPEVAKRWRKEAAQAAAASLLGGIAANPALVAAVSAMVTDGMAEGEADAMAVAAQDQGHGSLDIDAAMAPALATLRDDYGTAQRARDSEASLAAAVTAAAARALAASDDGSTEEETAEEMRSAASGAVSRWADWALWGALGAGAVALWQRASSALGSLFTSVDVYWTTDSSPCALCQANASGSPYAPEDVPPFPGHRACRCDLESDTRMPVSWLAAFLS